MRAIDIAFAVYVELNTATDDTILRRMDKPKKSTANLRRCIVCALRPLWRLWRLRCGPLVSPDNGDTTFTGRRLVLSPMAGMVVAANDGHLAALRDTLGPDAGSGDQGCAKSGDKKDHGPLLMHQIPLPEGPCRRTRLPVVGIPCAVCGNRR